MAGKEGFTRVHGPRQPITLLYADTLPRNTWHSLSGIILLVNIWRKSQGLEQLYKCIYLYLIRLLIPYTNLSKCLAQL